MRRVFLLALGGLCALALSLPGYALAYGWPLAPFDRQHAIRAFFDDPRTEFGQESFHFGIDIAAPDGTPVYAVAPGIVHLRPDGVTVVSQGHVFGYWHIVPSVAQGQRVQLQQRVGVVAIPWGHVHFADSVGGEYVNPLRPHALEPYVDTTSPTIAGIYLWSQQDRVLSPTRISGTIELVVNAYDTPPPPLPPPPWSFSRVTPALLRWRILEGTRVVRPWSISVDFRVALLPPESFTLVYAPGTRQNRGNHPGRYQFFLVRRWNTRSLTNGTYRLEVSASDTQGNLALAGLTFRIQNEPVQRR